MTLQSNKLCFSKGFFGGVVCLFTLAFGLGPFGEQGFGVEDTGYK